MITAETAIRAVLLADATIASMVGDRIKPHARSKGTLLPCGIYRRNSAGRSRNLTGPSGRVKAHIRIEWLAEFLDDCTALADRARRVLDGYDGDVVVDGETVKIQVATLDDDSTDETTPTSGAGAGYARVVHDYSVVYTETVGGA